VRKESVQISFSRLHFDGNNIVVCNSNSNYKALNGTMIVDNGLEKTWKEVDMVFL
jgi:hypothetical protein